MKRQMSGARATQTAKKAHPLVEETLRRRAKELAVLQEMVLDITIPHDLPTLLQTIVERATRILDADGGALYVCDEERQECRLEVSYKTLKDYTGTVLKYGEGAAGKVAQTGKPLVIDDYRSWPGRAAVYEQEAPFRAVLVVPMIWQGQVIGVIDMLRDRRPGVFTKADRELLTMFANHAAIATANARLLQGLQQELTERKQAEIALRESEEKFRTLADESPNMIFINKQGRIIYANARCEELMGYTLEEFYSPEFDFYKIIAPESILKVKEAYKAHRKGKEVSPYEYCLVTKQGRRIEALYSSKLIRYKGEDAILGVVTDLGPQKLAEKALQENEARFRSLIEHATDMVLVLEPDGRIKYASPSVEGIMGYKPEQMMSRNVVEFIHPDDRSRIMDELQGAIHNPDNRRNVTQARIKHVDGSWHIHEGVGTNLLGDPAIAGFVLNSRDITESNQVERALRESEEKFRNIIEQASEGFVLVNEQGQVIEWNQAQEDILGIKRAEVLGTNFWEVLFKVTTPERQTEERRNYFKKVMLDAVQTGQSPIFNRLLEAALVRPDGEYRFIEQTVFPVKTDRGFRIASLTRDITARKRSEDALQRQLKELTILQEVALAGTQASSIDDLVERVTQIIGERLYPDNFGVILLDEKQQALVTHDSYRLGDVSESAPKAIPVEEGVTGWVIRTGQSYRVADVHAEPRYIGFTRGMHSELCVPILVAGWPIGVINAESHERDFFSEDDERLLSTIAVQMGNSIEKLRSLDAERRRRWEAETLRQAAAAVSSSLELREVLEAILISLKKVVPYDSASVMLLEVERLRLMAAQGFTKPEQIINLTFPASDELFQETQRTGKPMILADAGTDKRFKKWAGTDYVRGWMGVPLIVRNKVTGYITLDSRQPSSYNEESAQLAQTFAHQAAVAIENARLYEQAVKASERRGILYQAGQEIARVSQDPEQVYTTVHHAASQLMPTEGFVITLLDEAHREAEAVYLFDKIGRSPYERFPMDEGLSGHVIATGRPIVIGDIAAEPFEKAVHFGAEEEVRSVLAVPLRLGDKVIGMLSAQSYQPFAYTDEDRLMLEMLAAYAAVAIENSRLYTETRRRLTELEVINRISTNLRSAQTVEDMLPRLLDESLKALESDSGAIWLHDPSTGTLKLVVKRGWLAEAAQSAVKPGEDLVGTVFSTSQSIVSKEFATDLLIGESMRKWIPKDWGGACVPIRTALETIGVLFIAVQLPRQLHSDDIHLLAMISDIAGNAIRRADLYEQTERQVQRLASLRAIDTAISTILDLRVTLGVLLDHIITQLNVDAVDVLLLNPNTQTLEYGASVGFRTDSIKQTHLYLGEGLAGAAVRKRSPVYISDLAEDHEFIRRNLLAKEGFVSYIGVPLIAKGQVKGVLEVFHRTALEPDVEWRSFLDTLAGQTAIAIDNAALFEELQRINLDLSLAYDATIEGWSKALDLRDRETEGHTLRVTEMTLQLARMMGIGDSEMVHIRRGALLHDIGKMGVPDSILNKPGKLNDEEWKIMYQHPVFAYEMLSPISYLRFALDIPFGHHERWNGSGYPRGLSGEQIPLSARIFAVADVWDALIHDRPYRKAWNRKAALEYIRRNGGKLFDRRVVEMLLKMLEQDQQLHALHN